MKRKFLYPFVFGLLIAVAFIFNACTNRNFERLHPVDPAVMPPPCDTTSAISYSAHIAVVLSTNCNIPSCHSTAIPGGGYDLSNYNGVYATALSGKLLSCVVWDGNASAMPKNVTARISTCDIGKIRSWLNAGALNN